MTMISELKLLYLLSLLIPIPLYWKEMFNSMSLPHLPKELFILTSSVFSTSIHPSSSLTVASAHTPLRGHHKPLVAKAVGPPHACLMWTASDTLNHFSLLKSFLSCLSHHPISWFLSYLSGLYLLSSSAYPLNVDVPGGFCPRPCVSTTLGAAVAISMLGLPFLDLLPRSLF